MKQENNMYLFVKKNDTECNLASSLLDLKNWAYDICDIDNDKFFVLVEKYGIGKVPTLIIADNNGILDEARGIDAISNFINLS
ncbi:MAG: hypothetical protein ACMXYG_00925 [Candidatus Woesearchaeota archaeon]